MTICSIAAAALSAVAPDLLIQGSQSAVVAIGSPFHVELTADPGLPALVLLDSSPGPVALFGQIVDLGFTPFAFVLASGTTDPSGEFAFTVPTPLLPGLVGSTFHAVGAVLGGGHPSGIEFTPGASVTFAPLPTGVVAEELAGVVRAAHPYFSWVEVLAEGQRVYVAVDPDAHPTLVGQSVVIHVTEARTAAEWLASPGLVDVTSSGPTTVVISAAGIAANRFIVDDGSLDGDGGERLGVGYDVVIDVDGDGLLGPGDLIDGFGDRAGFYVCRDPGLPGPYAVSEAIYSGGTWLGQKLYWPANVAQLSNLPLVIIGHGNGHNYLWYDHIGQHLASYGYVVMSHQNNTGPGVAAAATTTLTNTDYLLGNLATIAGGALLGKIDTSRMMWLGHSRGGEGVAIAYDRIVDGVWTPAHYTLADIRLVSSMAPTDFLGTGTSTVHGNPFHLWVAAADSDVTGCSSSDIAQSKNLMGRALDQRQSITIYGAGHGDLHAGTGLPFATGPCLIGKTNTHLVMRAYVLPLAEYHLRDNPAGKDWLVRQYRDLAPLSVTTVANPCIVVTSQFREPLAARRVIDSFQGATTATASSGAAIDSLLVAHHVGRLDDPNTDFTANINQPFNGMTYARPSDSEAGAVVRFDFDGFLRYTLLPAQRDWTAYRSLSVRVCQSTRDSLTIAEMGDADFSLRIRDEHGNASVIRVGNLRQGIEEPYQRTGCGIGAGWANEFETVRVTLQQFKVGAPTLDLERIATVELLFGPSWGSPFGFFGIDDLELNKD